MRKRIFALLLSFVLCFAMAGNAFAAGSAGGSFSGAVAGSESVVVQLDGLTPNHIYIMCHLLVREAGKTEESDFKTVWVKDIQTKDAGADYSYKKTFRAADVDEKLVDVFPLQAGMTLRFKVTGVDINDGKDYIDYTVPQGKYYIDVSYSDGGVVKYNDAVVFGDIPVNAGEDAVFTFVPDEGYMIDKVLVDGTEISPAPSAYPFHSVSADHSLRVTFKEVPLPEGPFRITASANGGEFPEDAVTEVWTDKDGHLTQEQIDSLTQPTMEGYTFKGWYMDTEHDVEVTPEIRFASDYVIEAQWTDDSGSGRRPGGGGGGGGSTKPANKTPTNKTPEDSTPQEPTGVTFNDVPASFWASKEINWAGSKGIMSGYGGGVFAPDRQVTRQQLWMVLGRLNGANPADMKAARDWAMTNSVSDGSRPTSSMTRQQMVTMLYRYAQMKGYATTGGVSISSYPDASKVSSYAQEALSWAVGNGIMLGDSSGRLNPTGTASRAHFAVFMHRFCTLYGIA